MAAAAGATRGCACPSIRTTLAAPAAGATSATSGPGRISVSPSAAFYADVDGLCYTARHDDENHPDDRAFRRRRGADHLRPRCAGEDPYGGPRTLASRGGLRLPH